MTMTNSATFTLLRDLEYIFIYVLVGTQDANCLLVANHINIM